MNRLLSLSIVSMVAALGVSCSHAPVIERYSPAPGQRVAHLDGEGSLTAEVREVRCWKHKFSVRIKFHNPADAPPARFKIQAVNVDYGGSVYPAKYAAWGEHDVDFASGGIKEFHWFFEVTKDSRDWPQPGTYNIQITGIDFRDADGNYKPSGKTMKIPVEIRGRPGAQSSSA